MRLKEGLFDNGEYELLFMINYTCNTLINNKVKGNGPF